MFKKIIAIASDHAGYELKVLLGETLELQGFSVLDLGTDGLQPVDYSDFADDMAKVIRNKEVDRGVLICGTGIGISIAANRHTELRAALIHDALGARLSRQHNDANIIVFGGRTIGTEVAKDCLDLFLSTEFEGGRHKQRIYKTSKI
ncbi:MAG: ribose 5-phosphate isomerase B [Rhodospirillaceae bacterium]|jgi:ribose 5-phosphate isomerase B|nr:ribose 5-phosphate isomerase B [Rhodospirillaceae bacterium]